MTGFDKPERKGFFLKFLAEEVAEEQDADDGQELFVEFGGGEDSLAGIEIGGVVD